MTRPGRGASTVAKPSCSPLEPRTAVSRTGTPNTAPPTQRLILEDFPSPKLARQLSPNGRSHWRTKLDAKNQAQRRIACEVLAQQIAPMYGPVRLMLRWVFPTNGRHDLDNLVATSKPMIDSLVEAGVLEDDDSKHVVGVTAEAVVERGRRALVIEIESVEA